MVRCELMDRRHGIFIGPCANNLALYRPNGMKFTFNWLKDWADIDLEPATLGATLTMAGLEVEAVVPLAGLENGVEDWHLEISVTPNRGDCLGILGIAREVVALAGGRLKSPPSLQGKNAKLGSRVAVSIEDPQACGRYSARIIDGVTVGPSPPGCVPGSKPAAYARSTTSST